MKAELAGVKSQRENGTAARNRHPMSRVRYEPGVGRREAGVGGWESSVPSPKLLAPGYHLHLGFPRRDFRTGRAHEHIHFAPDAELALEIDPRLHREPHAR